MLTILFAMQKKETEKKYTINRFTYIETEEDKILNSLKI